MPSSDKKTHDCRVGCSRVDITPEVPVPLDGFGGRDRPAERIHDPLTATALALERLGRCIVIVCIDLLELADDHVAGIKARVAEAHALAPRDVILNFSHTHAGPRIKPRYLQALSGADNLDIPDPVYLRRTLTAIEEAIGAALANLQPAQASWGMGRTSIGINRRARNPAVYRGPNIGYRKFYVNFPNPEGAVDRSCPVIVFRDPGGAPLAVLFGAACHPTTMSHDNYQVSAEFPGVTRALLETEFEGALALFMQGSAGDVKPRRVALEDSFRSGDFADVEAVGRELYEDVRRVIDNELHELKMCLRAAETRVALPIDPNWSRRCIEAILEDPDEVAHRRIWAGNWIERLRHGESLPRIMKVPIGIVQFAADFKIAWIGGELLTGMGQRIAQTLDPQTTWPCGYCNGLITYIPDAAILREGGYEAREVIFCEQDMPGPWAENIEPTLLGVYAELLHDLH